MSGRLEKIGTITLVGFGSPRTWDLLGEKDDRVAIGDVTDPETEGR